MTIQQIYTPRTTLIPLSESDNQFIYDSNKGNVKKYFIDFKSIDEVDKWIQENIQKMENGEKLEMVIVDNETQNKVGMVALDSLQSSTLVPRLWIADQFQRQGYASECLDLFINEIQKMYKQDGKKIVYEVDCDNYPSIKLAEKLGFQLVRTEEDEIGEYFVYIK